MNKNIVLGIGAFGGLVLLTALIFHTPSQEKTVAEKSTEVPAMTIPSDIPSFPIYPDVSVQNKTDGTSDSARDISLSLSATTTIEAVNAWYRNELHQNGWSIKSDKNVGGYQIIQGEKDNLYTSMQAANGSDVGTVTISQHLKIRN